MQTNTPYLAKGRFLTLRLTVNHVGLFTLIPPDSQAVWTTAYLTILHVLLPFATTWIHEDRVSFEAIRADKKAVHVSL